MLLLLVELIMQALLAVDEVIDSIWRRPSKRFLKVSAEQVAGLRTPGKSSGEPVARDSCEIASIWPIVRSK